MRALVPILAAACLTGLTATDAFAQSGGGKGRSSAAAPTTNPTGNPPARGTGAPWDRSGQSRADWLLAQRLSVIDHVRNVATKNGNDRLKQQADRLEDLARDQHARRIGDYDDHGHHHGHGNGHHHHHHHGHGHGHCPDPATP
uniref:Uncharacterized protein n=1 Tax=Schlesneria paludicola TaxID=360056 RepID=A0A7C2P163_9PLAN